MLGQIRQHVEAKKQHFIFISWQRPLTSFIKLIRAYNKQVIKIVGSKFKYNLMENYLNTRQMILRLFA